MCVGDCGSSHDNWPLVRREKTKPEVLQGEMRGCGRRKLIHPNGCSRPTPGLVRNRKNMVPAPTRVAACQHRATMPARRTPIFTIRYDPSTVPTIPCRPRSEGDQPGHAQNTTVPAHILTSGWAAVASCACVGGGRVASTGILRVF